MSDTQAGTGAYKPSPIEALTSHTVEQQTLEVLKRIEVLLTMIANNTRPSGTSAIPVSHEEPTSKQEPKRGRLSRK